MSLLEPFGDDFRCPGCFRSENSEKLEIDDLLNENCMFLKSKRLQNEVEME